MTCVIYIYIYVSLCVCINVFIEAACSISLLIIASFQHFSHNIEQRTSIDPVSPRRPMICGRRIHNANDLHRRAPSKKSHENAIRSHSALPASKSSYLTPWFVDPAAARRTGEGCPARRTRRSTTARSQASGFLYVTGVSRSFSFYWIGSQSVSFYI